METLEIQRLLRQSFSPDTIKEHYHINYRRHQEYPNLVSFSYGPETDMSMAVARECRGIVLDQNNNWGVVSRGFDKFFNLDEPGAAKVNWHSARVQEKCDGTLIMAYFYKGEWQAATTGTPDASGEVGFGSGFTFRKLFWDVANGKGVGDTLRRVPNLRDYTLMFELMTPINRIVVKHERAKLTLLGLRHRMSGMEYDAQFANVLVASFDKGNELPMFDLVRTFPFRNFLEVVGSFEHMDPLVQEGYVVVDSFFNRVKIKHPKYIALHHIRSGASPRRFLELIRSGESFEARKGIEALNMPMLLDEFDDVSDAYYTIIERMEEDWQEAPQGVSRKEFAMWATTSGICPPYLFARLDGHCQSARDFLQRVPLPSLEKMLGIKTPATPAAEATEVA